MFKKATKWALLCCVLLSGGLARADIPRVINFQGRLAIKGAATPTPVSGPVQMTFSIYPTLDGGEPCHQGSAQTVTVASGLFNVRLGEAGGINSACTFTSASYIALKVEGDQEMSPRILLPVAPYALAAAGLAKPGTSEVLVAGHQPNQIPYGTGHNAMLNAEKLKGSTNSAYAAWNHTHGGGPALYSCLNKCGFNSLGLDCSHCQTGAVCTLQGYLE